MGDLRCRFVGGYVPRKRPNMPRVAVSADALTDCVHTTTRGGAEEYIGQETVMAQDFTGRTPSMAVLALAVDACPATCGEGCPCREGEDVWATMAGEGVAADD